MILPIVYLSIRSFSDASEAWDLFFRERTIRTFLRTAMLIIGVTSASIAIAVPIAWLTVRSNLPFRRVITVMAILPLSIPSYVGALVVIAVLGPKGSLQQGLEVLFNVERLPEIYGFPGAMLSLTLMSYPFVLLTVRSGLFKLDMALEETSRSLGSGQVLTFLRITLPQLRSSIAAGALLVALYTLSDFGAVSLLRYETFSWSIFLQYEGFNRGLAAVQSLMLVVVAFLILFGENKMRGKGRYHRVTSGAIRPFTLMSLGRWRWPAFTFCTSVIFTSLAVPVAILCYWTIQGLYGGQTLDLMWDRAFNSILISISASLIIVIASLPIAFLSIRYPSLLNTMIEKLCYVGFALPGIVVALALVFFGISLAPLLYQTVFLLLFAYLILFLPVALGVLRASILQVNPSIEESARSLGRTNLRVFITITLPLLKPAILAGASLVFLATLKELPATLLLSPPGFQTLATSIWFAASEAFFARAAAPALLLIFLASIPTTWLLLREGNLKQ